MYDGFASLTGRSASTPRPAAPRAAPAVDLGLLDGHDIPGLEGDCTGVVARRGVDRSGVRTGRRRRRRGGRLLLIACLSVRRRHAGHEELEQRLLSSALQQRQVLPGP